MHYSKTKQKKKKTEKWSEMTQNEQKRWKKLTPDLSRVDIVQSLIRLAILDKLIYLQDCSTIFCNMGQFQVGNQKKRGIRDHTFIAHAVVNEARMKGLQMDIQFTDIKQCFDSIWLDEATNDLYNSGVTSRSLNILYEGNRKTRMCIETIFGKSERVELKNSDAGVCTRWCYLH